MLRSAHHTLQRRQASRANGRSSRPCPSCRRRADSTALSATAAETLESTRATFSCRPAHSAAACTELSSLAELPYQAALPLSSVCNFSCISLSSFSPDISCYTTTTNITTSTPHLDTTQGFYFTLVCVLHFVHRFGVAILGYSGQSTRMTNHNRQDTLFARYHFLHCSHLLVYCLRFVLRRAVCF